MLNGFITILKRSAVACACGAVLHGEAALAANATANLSINVAVVSSATLSLGATTLSFRAQDPLVNPTVAAEENPVPVVAKIRSKEPLTLFVLALDDLRSGDAVIPASAITWKAGGDPFLDGTLSKTVSQAAARFPTGSGSHPSFFNFFLTNQPSYLPGTYATTITYTLTTP